MTKYDLVLYGATGFTGKLVANYLASHPSGGHFSWAIAGRNPKKLTELRASLSGRGDGPGVVVAEASDAASVSSMVTDTRVVITTAGPYSEYHGDTLVGNDELAVLKNHRATTTESFARAACIDLDTGLLRKC